jgi:hypothetical protein
MARSFDPIQTINREVVKSDDVSLVLNELGLHALGYALPPGVPFKYVPTVSGGKKDEVSSYGNLNLSQDYLALRNEHGQEYCFQLDPILAVSGKNIIARRYVAKGSLQGTVKESFSQDDFDITITGVLMGDDAKDLNEQVQELQSILVCGESLAVVNDLLNDGYGITRLVVDSFQFPHTKGLQNQSYTIKCYSDSSINILEEVQ